MANAATRHIVPTTVCPTSLGSVERLLQSKLLERTSKEYHEKRGAYKLFGMPSSGLTKSELRKHLMIFGIMLGDTDMDQFFQRYGPRNGKIDWHNFINKVMPEDFPDRTSMSTTPWASTAVVSSLPVSRHVVMRPHLKRGHNPLGFSIEKVSTAEVEKLIKEKVAQKVITKLDFKKQIYQLLDRPQNGLTLAVFKNLKTRLNIPCTDAQIEALMNKYDKRGS
jgi:Ca2+-binding EF-hand superfamily protein